MRKFVLAVVLVLMASGAQAATLNVVGGQLMGASGVLVDGSLYDVQFLNGTCIDLYNGCDSFSDFTFHPSSGISIPPFFPINLNSYALLASNALLNQVFLDGPSGAFHSDTSLTNGCTGATVACYIWTPFSISGDNPNSTQTDVVQAQLAGIGPGGSSLAGASTLSSSTDLSGFIGYGGVWAVWSSPVPEPNTALLLSLGLVGLSARRRSLRS